MDAPAKQMQDYWHIPRASLVSSSSSAISSASSSKSSNKSNSNPPTLAQRSIHSTANSNGTSAAVTAAAAAAVLAAAKRGSRSSQGSSDSNNSTRSAASGSLLLTAANLERFAEIHKKQERQHKMLLSEQLPSVHGHSSSSANYNANLALASNAKDAVIPIDADPNLQYVRTKDLDTVSIASSMHFTMVNGEPGGAKKPKRGLCDRGRQVTVLIVSMSTIFMLLIMGMVYALEMRARDMPKS
ncbi:protein MTL1 isoform X1 [Drosophila hydei]|uniref:Protein MTL1 isoform X1 n=2 Tax=Drosophila hydei TaxID=7224 RepID=A0A6J1MSW8_DROHY|nr:protein MTL1 isoform X1 [Drosophila hydei]